MAGGQDTVTVGSNSVTTVERLREGNWPVWSRRVKYLLADLGLDDALIDSASPNSKKVMAKLVALVQDEWVGPVDACKNAAEAWSMLQGRFAGKSAARKQELWRELADLKMASTESVSSYILRGKQLKGELDTVGLVVPEEQVVIAVLQGLPKAYESISDVLSTSPPSLDELLSKLLPREKSLKREEAAPAEVYTAAAAKPKPAGKKTAAVAAAPKQFRAGSDGSIKKHVDCWKCGKWGHHKENCPQTENSSSSTGVSDCLRPRLDSHRADVCAGVSTYSMTQQLCWEAEPVPSRNSGS